jgi:hypothetical protein
MKPDDITLHLKDHKNCTKKLLDLMNFFEKVSGYNINIQKLVACLYAKN